MRLLTLRTGNGTTQAVRQDGDTLVINGDGLKFAARALSDKAPATSRVRRGALIRITSDDKGNWQITQMPQVESAFVSVAGGDHQQKRTPGRDHLVDQAIRQGLRGAEAAGEVDLGDLGAALAAEAALVLEEIGRNLAPSPFLTTAVVAVVRASMCFSTPSVTQNTSAATTAT